MQGAPCRILTFQRLSSQGAELSACQSNDNVMVTGTKLTGQEYIYVSSSVICQNGSFLTTKDCFLQLRTFFSCVKIDDNFDGEQTVLYFSGYFKLTRIIRKMNTS